MELTQMALYRGIKQKMDWLTQRQSVLSENIANANTPGYVSRDLEKPNFRSLVRDVPRINVATTEKGHMQGIRREGTRDVKDPTKQPYEVTISGNTVSLEQQLMKVSETQADFRLVTNLYRQNVGMLKMAVGRQPGA